jgi:hypothetical protein
MLQGVSPPPSDSPLAPLPRRIGDIGNINASLDRYQPHGPPTFSPLPICDAVLPATCSIGAPLHGVRHLEDESMHCRPNLYPHSCGGGFTSLGL